MFVSLCPRLFTVCCLEYHNSQCSFVQKIINLHCWKSNPATAACPNIHNDCRRTVSEGAIYFFCFCFLKGSSVVKFYVYLSVAWNQPVNIHSLVNNNSVRRVSKTNGNDKIHTPSDDPITSSSVFVTTELFVQHIVEI